MDGSEPVADPQSLGGTTRADRPNVFGLVFCGGGPAAMGPFVAAARTGRLDDLLDQGVAIVEPGIIGPGALAHHRVSANSLGGPFLECLNELTGDPAFSELSHSPEAEDLRRYADAHPPLLSVGRFLTRLGEVLGRLIRAHPRCAVLESTVTGLRLGTGRVSVHTAAGETLSGRRVVIATGGRPPTGFQVAKIVPGLSLYPYRHRVQHAESLIDARRTRPVLGRRVAVVGGSHSAWSVADLLLDRRSADHDVAVISRSPIRIYYTNAEEACADGYAFDPVWDVCPISGRVNRYGGLRGRAATLAKASLHPADYGSSPVRLVQLAARRGGEVECHSAEIILSEADVIVSACGFEAALPPIQRADGSSLTAAQDPTGTIVTSTGHLVDEHGVAHPELIAYGLGAGLGPIGDVGGEPSYARRADGVWLYQHDVGQIVLSELLSSPVDRAGSGRPRGQEKET